MSESNFVYFRFRMSKLLYCVFFLVIAQFMGCTTVSMNPVETDLMQIKNAATNVLRARNIDQKVQMESNKGVIILRYWAISMASSYDGKTFYGTNLHDALISGREPLNVNYFYLIQTKDEYILISDLFVPHIGDFNPLGTLATTRGYYVLHITASPQLRINIQKEMEMFKYEVVTNNNRTFDGSRIDVIETINNKIRTSTIYINPNRTNNSEDHKNNNLKVCDNLYELIWKSFM